MSEDPIYEEEYQKTWRLISSALTKVATTNPFLAWLDRHLNSSTKNREEWEGFVKQTNECISNQVVIGRNMAQIEENNVALAAYKYVYYGGSDEK